MKKNYKLFLPLIFAIGLLMVIEAVKPKPLDWRLSFSAKDKIPFGSFVLFDLLGDIFPEGGILTSTKPVYNTLPDTTEALFQNYLFITDNFNPGPLDTKTLLSFIDNGGNVFISSQTFDDSFSDSLGFVTKPKFDQDSLIAETNLLKTSIGLTWYFDKIDSSRTQVLDFDADSNINFIKITIGDGQLFVHTVPLLFTNYRFLKPGKAQQAAKLLSHLPNKPIIWDEYFKPDNARMMQSSPLKFILRTDSLRWAYFLAMAGILLFIFVEGKRKQRIIPIIKPLTNDSLNFVDVIGRLHYNQANHADVAIKMRTYLLEFIRTNFNLDTSLLDEPFIQKLSAKTAIEKDELENLFQKIKQINQGIKLSSNELIEINRDVEGFYEKCKMHP